MSTKQPQKDNANRCIIKHLHLQSRSTYAALINQKVNPLKTRELRQLIRDKEHEPMSKVLNYSREKNLRFGARGFQNGLTVTVVVPKRCCDPALISSSERNVWMMLFQGNCSHVGCCTSKNVNGGSSSGEYWIQLLVYKSIT